MSFIAKPKPAKEILVLSFLCHQLRALKPVLIVQRVASRADAIKMMYDVKEDMRNTYKSFELCKYSLTDTEKL